MYIDFSYYNDNGGTVDSSAFPPLLKKSEYKLDYWTQDRLKALEVVPDSAKDLLVEMINRYSEFESATMKGVASFNNDGVSVSFSEAITLESVNDKLYDLAIEMLPIEIITATLDTEV
jgi:hypothetical protein